VKLPIRRRVSPPSGRAVQRASAGLSVTRALAALVLLGVSGGLYALTVRDEFRLDPARVTVEGAVYTQPDAVTGALGLEEGARPNVFRIRTVDLAAALQQLPAVVDADVDVILPDRLAVRLHERVPILVWRGGDERLLMDQDGVHYVRVPAGVALPAGLPVVDDRRERPVPPTEGERLEAVDLAAVRQLGAVTPAMLGSGAAGVALSLDDVEGFTLDAQPGQWHAIFGFYTPQLRPPEMIPGQVQCLAALLAQSEPAIRTVILSPAEGRCGTYRAGATPSPSASRSGSEAPSAEPSTGPSASGGDLPSPSGSGEPSAQPSTPAG
jgi:cell division septal protein FtsQ